MKSIVLLLVLSCCLQNIGAQVNNIPAGKYETSVKEKGMKWEKGDLIILNETQYKLTSSNETGEYKFSAIAQRVFFTSGPLKSFFAKTVQNNNNPVIVFPATENELLGIRIAGTDVWSYYRN
jgi:hypothetical protein